MDGCGMSDDQLELFGGDAPQKPARRPVTRGHIVLAKRVARIINGRGPLHVTELATFLGAELPDVYLAVGIAGQWRRVDLCDGFVVPAAPHEGKTA